MKNKQTAAIYARFSSDNQRDASIDAQVRAIKEYAMKNNIIVPEKYIYVDKAKTATTDNREEFLRMIFDSAYEEFSTVLVHKLDRFSRSRKDSLTYRAVLKKNDVNLVSVLEPLDEESPESIILQSVLEGMAEYYSVNLAREVRKGMKENALQCISTGGVPPLGYRVSPETKKLEINEEEAPAIRHIFHGIIDGKGYDQIIHELNSLGYVTRAGKPFGRTSIHEIIRNEKYMGVYVFNRSASKGTDGKRNNHAEKNEEDIIRIEGGVPAIVDAETFNAVTQIRISRKKLSPRQGAKETYLLSGKIECGECGKAYIGNRKFSGRNKTLHVTYRCNTRSRMTSEECSNKEIRREYIESFVIKELTKVIFDDNKIPELIRKYEDYRHRLDESLYKRIEAIQKEISEVDRKISNIISAIANSGSTTLLTALSNFEEEKIRLENLLEDEKGNLGVSMVSEEQIRKAYKQARDLFLSGELEEKRQLINLYLDKVMICKEHVEVYLNVLPVFLMPLTKSVANHGGGEGS